MSDILDGKSEEEIRRAAALWFHMQQAYLEGENVPPSVFLVDTRDLTPGEIADGIELGKRLKELFPECAQQIEVLETGREKAKARRRVLFNPLREKERL